jgi:hypothetical protein
MELKVNDQTQLQGIKSLDELSIGDEIEIMVSSDEARKNDSANVKFLTAKGPAHLNKD